MHCALQWSQLINEHNLYTVINLADSTNTHNSKFLSPLTHTSWNSQWLNFATSNTAHHSHGTYFTGPLDLHCPPSHSFWQLPIFYVYQCHSVYKQTTTWLLLFYTTQKSCGMQQFYFFFQNGKVVIMDVNESRSRRVWNFFFTLEN